MFILRPRPECEVSLLVVSVKHKKEIVLFLKKRDFAVLASLQLSLVYQCEAPQI